MAGNRKINNEEQLASVRAKLNDNFDDLSDITTQLQPLTAITGGGDGFMRANADGTFDTIKTAPPDGGLGGNSTIQSKHSFAGKIPDEIVLTNATGIPILFQLAFVNGTTQIAYYDKRADGKRYVFNLDGSHATTGSNTSYFPYEGATASLQEIIDGGHAIFHGQKSGTGGLGSLSLIKSLVNQSANGGFYTEIPDAIAVSLTSTNTSYNAILYLDLVKPNSTAGTASGATWEIIYRGTYSPTTDLSIRFHADNDGTQVVTNGYTGFNSPTSDITNNLRWYIENGRALYFGGQQDYGVKAWGKFDGTGSGSLSFTGGNVASITKVSSGLYKVTLTNPAPHADYSISGSANPQNFSGAYFGVREDTNPVTTTDFHIEIRDSTPARRDSNRISFQVVY